MAFVAQCQMAGDQHLYTHAVQQSNPNIFCLISSGLLRFRCTFSRGVGPADICGVGPDGNCGAEPDGDNDLSSSSESK